MKQYTIYCKDKPDAITLVRGLPKLARAWTMLCHDTIGLRQISTMDDKARDYIIQRLSFLNIPIYGFRMADGKREYRIMTKEELAPHLEKVLLCTSKSGKQYFRRLRKQQLT